MKRELRIVEGDKVVGALVVNGKDVRFEGAADGILRAQRLRLGDAKVAAQIMDGGWSNGYLYFGKPVP